MNLIERHDSTWNDRLQDLLDGDLASLERDHIEAHLAACARCRAHYAQLKRLDAKLSLKLSSATLGSMGLGSMDPVSTGPVLMGLDGSFDRQVLARIDALDESARERARRRAEHEFHDNLQALTRGWHRGLASLIGGAVAALALAFAFTAWANAAGIPDKMLDAAQGLGAHADLLHLLLIASIGALIGGGISRWVATTLE